MSHLEINTDVLVVGSGGAALRAALAADSLGTEVLIAVKGAPNITNRDGNSFIHK